MTALRLSYVITLVASLIVLSTQSSTHAAAAQSQIKTVSVGGVPRHYLLYQPSTAHTKAPLVIVLHGSVGDAAGAEQRFAWDRLADQKGFIVAYPDGEHQGWNASGSCCGAARGRNFDDIGFLNKVIEDTASQASIDPKRVYLTGFSAGAVMSYRYACDGSYKLAAIGSVAGTLANGDICAHPHPVSVLEIHGLADQNVPFAGSAAGYGWAPVQQVLSLFRQADQCGQPAENRQGVAQVSMAACAQGRAVELITLDGVGHQWPGGLSKDDAGASIDATAVLWQFFAGHAAP
jgi:polyhydroxybutyrate depolymerase